MVSHTTKEVGSFLNMWRRNTILVMSGFLIYFGLVDGSGAFLMLGLVAPFAGVLSFYIILQQSKLISAERICVEGACEQENVSVLLKITNAHRFPILKMRVLDHFEPEVPSEKEIELYAVLPGFSTVEFEYTGFCFMDRGHYELGPLVLELADPFGLFCLKKAIPIEHKFSVYPEVVALPPLPIRGGSPYMRVQGQASMQAGQGEEPFGVREYYSGDSMRLVHWPQTARTGELKVREHERIHNETLHILLDFKLEGRAGTGKVSVEEYGVQLAASLVARAVGEGQTVGLLANADTCLSIRPDCGHAHLCYVLESLIPIRQNSSTSLESSLSAYPYLQDMDATLWVIVSRVDFSEETMRRLLDKVRYSAGAVYVVMIDDTGMLAIDTSVEEKKTRPNQLMIADFLLNAGVSGFWWVDIEQGITESMKEAVFLNYD